MKDINKFQAKCPIPVTGLGGICDETIEHALPGSFIMDHYKEGDQVGNCIFIKEVIPYISPRGNKIRKALFRCECGNEFESHIVEVKRYRTTSCGCVHKGIISSHGMHKHPLYNRWLMMKHRCSNSNNVAYKYYGGRGIEVYNEWKDDFKAFFDYIMKLPNAMKSGYSIDRINNDGNYEPGNVRWATHTDQMNNTRKQKNKNH